MMQELEFSLWCDRLGLSELARRIVQEIRSSEPVRSRRSRVGNGTGRYSSKKMGRTIQFESRTVEFPAIYDMENDEAVFEFYDQPSKIEMRYMTNGVHPRPVVFWNTPDFFVLGIDYAGWEEWKPEEKLIELAESMPNRYKRDEQGHWRCPPGEAYAARYGLAYRVRSSAELNTIYLRNLSFLEDYLRDPHLWVDPTALKILRDLFSEEPVMTLKTLLEHIEAQHVYGALLQHHFYVDLSAAPFADPEYVHSFRDSEVARAYIILADSPYQPYDDNAIEIGIGKRIIWDGRAWTIYNHGDTSVALRSEQGNWAEIRKDEFHALISQGVITQPVEEKAAHVIGLSDEGEHLLARANTRDCQAANERYRLLQRYHSGETPEQLGVPYRTIRDWEVKCQNAERRFGHGYIGLLSKYQDSGNRQQKLPDDSIEIMMEYIKNDYETDRQKPKVHSWGQMVRACEAKGIHPPSYNTYCQAIKKRQGYEQTLKRKGRRAAYQEKVPYLLDQGTPRHGDFPWQIGHLDHDQLDIQLCSSRTGRVLGKPWATFMTDAYSRRILAVYLTYDPPSHRSDMMVIRECVRRHGRLPQILVVDGGSDFNSVYFESLLAFYNITKLERPAAEPRAGSVIERLFGTTNTGFINNLLGNTQASKKPREMTKSVDPRRKATWTLSAFYRKLCEWCYEVYDTRFHTTLERSPREEFEAGMVISGVRPYRDIKYNKTFFMRTSPTPQQEKAKVIERKGIKVHYEFYWSDKFKNPEVENTEVEVRYDPFDISRVFAFVQGEWTPCLAAHFAMLRNHSMRELQMISAELRKRRSISAQQFTLTIKHIAEFLASAEAEEKLGIQRLCDAEARDILQLFDVSYVDQFPLFQTQAVQLFTQTDDKVDNEVDEAELYGDYV